MPVRFLSFSCEYLEQPVESIEKEEKSLCKLEINSLAFTPTTVFSVSWSLNSLPSLDLQKTAAAGRGRWALCMHCIFPSSSQRVRSVLSAPAESDAYTEEISQQAAQKLTQFPHEKQQGHCFRRDAHIDTHQCKTPGHSTQTFPPWILCPMQWVPWLRNQVLG